MMPTAETERGLFECCKWHGLLFPDGVKRCRKHMTNSDLDLIRSLDERAVVIGVRKRGGEVLWPYGPNVDVGARQRMVEWAEKKQLRIAYPSYKCIHWLKKGRCGRRLCRWPDQNLSHWWDHATAWTYKGKPAVIVSQPYQLGKDGQQELAKLAEDPDLYVEVQPESWYGHGTIFIGIYRRDYLEALDRDDREVR